MPAWRQGRPGWPAESWVEGLTWAVERGLEILLADQLRGAVVAWLLSVYLNQPSAKSLCPRITRELPSPCLSLDLLIQDQQAKAVDVLAQRVRALERTQADGRRDAAQWLGLFPVGTVRLFPRRELRQALRMAEEECILRIL